jgi:hypothetical protein
MPAISMIAPAWHSFALGYDHTQACRRRGCAWHLLQCQMKLPLSSCLLLACVACQHAVRQLHRHRGG